MDICTLFRSSCNAPIDLYFHKKSFKVLKNHKIIFRAEKLKAIQVTMWQAKEYQELLAFAFGLKHLLN